MGPDHSQWGFVTQNFKDAIAIKFSQIICDNVIVDIR